MLFVILTIVLSIALILMSALVVYLVMTIKKNIRTQAAVTAELLMDAAKARRKAVIDLMRKYVQAVDLADARLGTILDLEASVEVLHTEINRLEEVLRLEHQIKSD